MSRDQDNRGAVALRVEMAARQLKQVHVAKMIGSDQGKVSLLRRGKVLPNLRESLALHTHLGIEPSWWLEVIAMGEPAASDPGGDSEGPSREGEDAA